MNPISSQIRIGTIGELLVALRLLQFGVQAAPPIKDSGNDLIAVKGEVFRAIQVKTTQSECFQLNNLPGLYHIVALVHLVGEDQSIYLDQSDVFLLEKKQITAKRYRIEDLNDSKMNETLVERLFTSDGAPSDPVRAPAEIAAQQFVGPERR